MAAPKKDGSAKKRPAEDRKPFKTAPNKKQKVPGGASKPSKHAKPSAPANLTRSGTLPYANACQRCCSKHSWQMAERDHHRTMHAPMHTPCILTQEPQQQRGNLTGASFTGASCPANTAPRANCMQEGEEGARQGEEGQAAEELQPHPGAGQGGAGWRVGCSALLRTHSHVLSTVPWQCMKL